MNSEIHLSFEGTTLAPQRQIKIVGVNYGSKVTFKANITQIARTGKLASLKRISCPTDGRGASCSTMYRSVPR